MIAGGIYKQGYKDKYYVIGRDGNKRFFPTKAEANAFRKRIYDKVAVWLNLYEIPRSERIKLFKEHKEAVRPMVRNRYPSGTEELMDKEWGRGF